MSLYTAGEIVIWLLIAALLGVVIGWLLRGMLRPPAGKSTVGTASRPVEPSGGSSAQSTGTRVTEIDTGASHTRTGSVRIDPGAIPQDDLLRIRGVGPKIAKLLESMGVTSYRQVALFTAADIAVVSDGLKLFPGRIKRDDWMSSARELHREVYGTEP